VDGERIHLLRGHTSIYSLALAGLSSAAEDGEVLDYDPIYSGRSEWRILPAIDHPDDPSRCMVSGTGLSHIRSAANRQAMHAAGEQVTDSMRMYQWGVEGGKPPGGQIGAAPEWFYKGTGAALRGHNQPLEVPAHADDGGEEPEIAGIYLIDQDGHPRRIGMAAGNEFSDHVLEKKNYLYLAASKLRSCALGPELVTNPDFELVEGEVSIERAGSRLWSKSIRTGESVMCHSLANIEHHHFKFEGHRRPGDLHVHFFGADAFSFGEGIRLAEGDVMQVRWNGFGRALRNPLRTSSEPARLVTVKELS
jgi:hypothetical protein